MNLSEWQRTALVTALCVVVTIYAPRWVALMLAAACAGCLFYNGFTSANHQRRAD